MDAWLDAWHYLAVCDCEQYRLIIGSGIDTLIANSLVDTVSVNRTLL